MDENKDLTPKKSPDENSEKPSLAPVVTGKVVMKKKSEFRKLLETLFKGDLNTVKQSIWEDIIVPAFQDTLYNMLDGASRGMIFGGRNEPRRRRDDERGIPARQVDFTRYSKRPEREERRSRDDETRQDLFNYGYIWFEYKSDAEAVLASMADICKTYKFVSVRQLFELSGVKTVWTDRDYGWPDLIDADIVRSRDGGWLLKLPRPRAYD